MTARWLALGVWVAVAASLGFWGLKLFVPGVPVPADATVASTAASPRGDLSRLLGADAQKSVAAAPPPSTRFQLVGVVAARGAASSSQGLALIAVDGKPARTYRVGAVVDGETVVLAVRLRGASLGPRGGAANVSLEIPPPAPAATGTLPAAGAAPPVRAPLPGAAQAARGFPRGAGGPPLAVPRSQPNQLESQDGQPGGEMQPTQ
jgi:general secretion pathway protein C